MKTTEQQIINVIDPILMEFYFFVKYNNFTENEMKKIEKSFAEKMVNKIKEL